MNCPWCGRAMRERRSAQLSRRFHAHVTWITQQRHGEVSRNYVYQMALLKAVEIDPPPGGDSYRYDIIPKMVEGMVRDVLEPYQTSDATNKEMITACRALEYLAVEWELGLLPEHKEDE